MTVLALVLAAAALVLAVLAGALALAATRRLRRTRDELVRVRAGATARDLLTAAAEQEARVAELREQVAGLRVAVTRARGEAAHGLRHVAVVRYDAFPDLGGQLSFSVAMVDDAGDGVVISSIAGPAEARVYAKGVSGRGPAPDPLSPEELEAVRAATSDPEEAPADVGHPMTSTSSTSRGRTAR